MNTYRRDELTFLGSHFTDLQGMRVVPFGGMLILWFILELFWHGTAAVYWIGPLSLVAAIAGYMLAGVYYRRTFGVVRQYGARIALHAAVSLGVYAVCVFLDGRQGLISVQLLFWTCFFLWGYYASARRRKYLVPFAALFLLCALLPLSGAIQVDRLFPKSVGSGLGTLVVGIAFVLTGILDHRLLVRSLPEPSRAGDD